MPKFKRARGVPKTRRIEALTSALLNQWSDRPEAQEYIRSQWSDWLITANTYSQRARNLFYIARWLMVVGATIVPTLVVLGVQTHGTVAALTQITAAVLSLLVAAASGALQVTQMGQRWHMSHKLRFELERAGVQFYLRHGLYGDLDPDQRFAIFVDRVESIMAEQESLYSSRVVQLGQEAGSTGYSGT